MGNTLLFNKGWGHSDETRLSDLVGSKMIYCEKDKRYDIRLSGMFISRRTGSYEIKLNENITYAFTGKVQNRFITSFRYFILYLAKYKDNFVKEGYINVEEMKKLFITSINKLLSMPNLVAKIQYFENLGRGMKKVDFAIILGLIATDNVKKVIKLFSSKDRLHECLICNGIDVFLIEAKTDGYLISETITERLPGSQTMAIWPIDHDNRVMMPYVFHHEIRDDTYHLHFRLKSGSMLTEMLIDVVNNLINIHMNKSSLYPISGRFLYPWGACFDRLLEIKFTNAIIGWYKVNLEKGFKRAYTYLEIYREVEIFDERLFATDKVVTDMLKEFTHYMKIYGCKCRYCRCLQLQESHDFISCRCHECSQWRWLNDKEKNFLLKCKCGICRGEEKIFY